MMSHSGSTKVQKHENILYNQNTLKMHFLVFLNYQNILTMKKLWKINILTPKIMQIITGPYHLSITSINLPCNDFILHSTILN